MGADSHGSDELKAILSNCDAKRDHNYRLGADSFTITTREYAVLRALVLLPSETRPTYEDGLEDAAQACERFSEERWALYKWGFGHERANNYTQGESDAGDKLAEVIRALKKADPQATEEKANPCGRSGPVGSAPCVAVPQDVWDWLMGENGDFEPTEEQKTSAFGPGRYWWRSELRKRVDERNG